MKKLTVMTAAVLLLAILFGCGAPAETTPNTTGNPDTTTQTDASTVPTDPSLNLDANPLFAIDKTVGMTEVLKSSVQINDGLKQTSADGVHMAFDTTYGIMFCIYMPGEQGAYGESRGRVSLSYFPASQPTNCKTIDISCGNREYIPQILSLGNGKVRLIYEKLDVVAKHYLCFRDFDAISETLSEEKVIQQKNEDGSMEDFTLRGAFKYLKANGCTNYTYDEKEYILAGGCTLFQGEDGYIYGAAMSSNAAAVLYRSEDNMETVEFFAFYPEYVNYEFDYVFLDGTIHAIYRTARRTNPICYVTSDDNGKTWSEPVRFKDSIACRPRIILHYGHVLMAYNYHVDDKSEETGMRPLVRNGRTAVRMVWGENPDPNQNPVVADLYSKNGMVNIAVMDIMCDVYLAYSTGEVGLDYYNKGYYSGKDAIRFVKLGDLTASLTAG